MSDDKLFTQAKYTYEAIKAPSGLREKILEEGALREAKQIKTAVPRKRRRRYITAFSTAAACFAVLTFSMGLWQSGDEMVSHVYPGEQDVSQAAQKSGQVETRCGIEEKEQPIQVEVQVSEDKENKRIDVDLSLAQEGEIQVSEGLLTKKKEEKNTKTESDEKRISVNPEERVRWSIDLEPKPQDASQPCQESEESTGYILEAKGRNQESVVYVLRKNVEEDTWEITEERQETEEIEEKE